MGISDSREDHKNDCISSKFFIVFTFLCNSMKKQRWKEWMHATAALVFLADSLRLDFSESKDVSRRKTQASELGLQGQGRSHCSRRGSGGCKHFVGGRMVKD